MLGSRKDVSAVLHEFSEELLGRHGERPGRYSEFAFENRMPKTPLERAGTVAFLGAYAAAELTGEREWISKRAAKSTRNGIKRPSAGARAAVFCGHALVLMAEQRIWMAHSKWEQLALGYSDRVRARQPAFTEFQQYFPIADADAPVLDGAMLPFVAFVGEPFDDIDPIHRLAEFQFRDTTEEEFNDYAVFAFRYLSCTAVHHAARILAGDEKFAQIELGLPHVNRPFEFGRSLKDELRAAMVLDLWMDHSNRYLRKVTPELGNAIAERWSS